MLAGVNSVAQRRLNHRPPATTRDLIWSIGDWFIYAFLTPAVFAISRRLPVARPVLVRRALLHVAISLLFCVAWATIGQVLQLLLAVTFDPAKLHASIAAGRFWPQFLHDWISWIFTTLPFGVAVYLCVVGVEHAIRYFVEARDRELQLSRLAQQLAGARLSALQAQLNPHFLFNSLNTIAVLVRDGDRSTAVRIVEHLSDLLRRTLSRTRANEVALEDEIDLVRQYLAVEQARFSDRLRPEWSIDPSAHSAAIPSFALQHLVENAVRHGISRRTNAGRVTIEVRRSGDLLEIAVADDGAGISAGAPMPEGHGIANTRERLRTLYGARASLTVEPALPQGTVATLRLPFHEMVAGASPPAA